MTKGERPSARAGGLSVYATPHSKRLEVQSSEIEVARTASRRHRDDRIALLPPLARTGRARGRQSNGMGAQVSTGEKGSVITGRRHSVNSGHPARRAWSHGTEQGRIALPFRLVRAAICLRVHVPM